MEIIIATTSIAMLIIGFAIILRNPPAAENPEAENTSAAEH